MKMHELAAVCRASADEADDTEYVEDERDDALTNTLGQLENCWALINALEDHFNTPKARMTAYFKRELARVGGEAAAHLIDYEILEATDD